MNIKITIPKLHHEQEGREALANIEITERLRAAGIPVIGRLFVMGVSYGVLSLCVALDGSHVFEWNPEGSIGSDEGDLFA